MDERLWGILMEALPRILYQGCVMTLPLAVGSFLLAVVIAVTVTNPLTEATSGV